MKYMLLIYADEKELPFDDGVRQACYAESAVYAQNLDKAGKFVAASPLQSVSTATSVRPVDGKRIVTDGPFAETREQLGGYFIIEATDLDEAVEIAKKVPGGAFGTVEIRPLVEVEGVPVAT